MINHTRPIHLTTAILLLLATGLQAQTNYPLRDAVECHPRNGLPNFLAKVEAGKTIKIAYLGGKTFRYCYKERASPR